MKLRCSKHGVVLRRGNYCPVCGKELIKVNLFPLICLYLERKHAIWIVIGLVSSVGLPFGVVNIRSCYLRSEERREAIVQTLAEPWQELYVDLCASTTLSRIDVLKVKVKSGFSSNSKLTALQRGIILDLFPSISISVAAGLLDSIPIKE